MVLGHSGLSLGKAIDSLFQVVSGCLSGIMFGHDGKWWLPGRTSCEATKQKCKKIKEAKDE